MISNRSIGIAVILCFLVPGLLGLGGRPDAPTEPGEQKSKSVKIERPQKAPDRQEAGSEQAAAAPAEIQQTRPESGEAATGQPDEVKPEARQTGTGEEIPAEAYTPDDAITSEEELGDLMLSEQEALFGDEERLYTRKGRVDPFEPFLRRPEPEAGSDEQGEEIRRRKPQTPLERIALSQLTLTAVLRMSPEKGPIAMVEDPTGKGYVVKKGTWIGDQGGQVSEILSDRIIVHEEYKDVFGKIAEREIEKKLQK